MKVNSRSTRTFPKDTPALKMPSHAPHYSQIAWKANLASASLFVMGMLVASMFKDDIRRALHLPVYKDRSQIVDETSKMLIKAIKK